MIIGSYFPDKRSGYIALQRNNFQFIGPDRDEIMIDSIEKCLEIAQIIRDICTLSHFLRLEY